MTRFVDPADLPSLEAWQQTVERDLKGRPFATLRSRLPEGIEVEPLYSRETHAVDPGTLGRPGQAPFRRGAHAPAARDGWLVCTELDLPSAEDARSAIDDDLNHGADAILLRFDRAARLGRSGDAATLGADGCSLASGYELARVLSSVDLSATPCSLDAGGNGIAALGLLVAVAERARVQTSALTGCLYHDPLAALLRDGALPFGLSAAWDDAATLVGVDDLPGITPLGVSCVAVHDAGGHAVDELAFLIASGIETLRKLEARGIAPARTASALAARLPVGRELFAEAAKLRAARLLWNHVVESAGLPQGPLATHATTSARTQSTLDPWVNMLRTSTAAFAAIVGGADSVSARAFDRDFGTPSPLGRRVARNAQLIARDESRLGHVADPAGGSWYVEALTDELARRAWERVQEIERRGGAEACVLDGTIARWCAESRDALDADIATRRAPLTGASAFANLDEVAPTRPAHDPERFAERRLAELRAEGRGASVAATLEGLATDGSWPKQRAAFVAGATIAAVASARSGGNAAACSPTLAPLPQTRDAAPFEALRSAPEHRAALLAVGPLAGYHARAGWAAAALAAGGIRLLEGDAVDGATAAEARARSASISLIAIPDALFAEWLPTLVDAARRAGSAVVIAGHPKKAPPGLRADAWIHVGCDLVDALTRIRAAAEDA